jgi:glycosyltransferase involved in cell wall biosynthesis
VETTLSLIVPALNEADNVPGLLARVDLVAAELPGVRVELVVVDDGSTDDTVERLRAAVGHAFDLRVVRLARNFGSHAAISAGLRECVGDCAIVLGADAQEPSSLVHEFLGLWREGNDVVWGVRRSRASRGLVSETASRLFSFLFSRYAGLENYPAEGPSGFLVSRQVIDELNGLDEVNRNVLALVAWLGYDQVVCYYDQLPRAHGESRWTTTKMVKLAVDSLIQFSSMPLRACTFGGIAVAFLGVLYAGVLVGRALLGVSTPSGWPTLLVVVLILGGTQLIVVGIVGEYLWRAVEQVRGRPLFVVRSRHFRAAGEVMPVPPDTPTEQENP